jgi:hypothetical protein
VLRAMFSYLTNDESSADNLSQSAVDGRVQLALQVGEEYIADLRAFNGAERSHEVGIALFRLVR